MEGVKTAAARYQELKQHRQDAERRAKRCARVTLPRLWVDEGAKTRKVGSAYVDTGPKCVNSLAAKVLLAWLPPNAGMFTLNPDPVQMASMADQAGVQASELELALSEVERAAINDMETGGVRTILGEAAKHAIVSGNFLIYDPDEGRPKLYPLSTYVVNRDGLGNVLEMITHDKIAPSLLPEDIRAAVVAKLQEANDSQETKDADVDLYTWIKRSEDGDNWVAVQEVEGFEVPETEATYPLEACPWIPVATPRSSVEDYGEGMVWDYVGAFESLEQLRKAIRKGAAALAKVILFLSPTSTVKPKQLTEAESGAVLVGNAQDVTTLQLQKSFDLDFVRQEADELKQSLETIFGVRTAIQRPGERVTAYEMRVLSQELDDAQGGFYSLTAEDLLLPLVRRRLAKMQNLGQLPDIPAEMIQPRITVGMAALGRGHDLTKLMEFGQAFVEMVGPEEARRRINSGEAGARLAAAADISLKGLLYSDEELAEAEEANAMQEGAINAAPQIAQSMMQPE